MSKSAKFRHKVEAIRAIEKEDDTHARILARGSRMFKIKQKKLILRSRDNQLIGTLFYTSPTKIRLVLAEGIKMDTNSDGTLLDFTLPGEKT